MTSQPRQDQVKHEWTLPVLPVNESRRPFPGQHESPFRDELLLEGEIEVLLCPDSDGHEVVIGVRTAASAVGDWSLSTRYDNWKNDLLLTIPQEDGNHWGLVNQSRGHQSRVLLATCDDPSEFAVSLGPPDGRLLIWWSGIGGSLVVTSQA